MTNYEPSAADRARWARRQRMDAMKRTALWLGMIGAMIGGQLYLETMPGQLMKLAASMAWRAFVAS